MSTPLTWQEEAVASDLASQAMGEPDPRGYPGAPARRHAMMYASKEVRARAQEIVNERCAARSARFAAQQEERLARAVQVVYLA